LTLAVLERLQATLGLTRAITVVSDDLPDRRDARRGLAIAVADAHAT
jgi:hypothetical protein